MAWLITLAVMALDILSKWAAATYLSQEPLVLIKGVLELTYVENRGAAWGMFQGARFIFIILTVIFLGVFLVFFIKSKCDLNPLSKVIFALIFSGALGNLVDRVWLGYVRDMIYFSLIDFPVFNIADSAIVIGTVLLIIQTLFFKNGIFDLLEKKWSENKKAEHNEH